MFSNANTKKGKKYICPICGSGMGNNGKFTPALSVDGETWKCFSCNNGGDIFNLVALKNEIDTKTKFNKVLNIVAKSLNVLQMKDLMKKILLDIKHHQMNMERMTSK